MKSEGDRTEGCRGGMAGEGKSKMREERGRDDK